MSIRGGFSFTRYLEAKKTVDDRALNRTVWAALAEALAERAGESSGPLQVLEAGAGIGTMLERALDWDLFDREKFGEVVYTAIDSDPQNLMQAGPRLRKWALARGFEIQALPGGKTPWKESLEDELPGLVYSSGKPPIFPPLDQGRGAPETGLRLRKPGQETRVHLRAEDILQFAAGPENQGAFDLLIAHAFLDLVHLPTALPALLGLLRPGGLFYFTLNFDGATLLEPAVDPELDELIQVLYHRTMDERRCEGKPSGDSRTGRHLFHYLSGCGAQILAAGASDWVVFPGSEGYPDEEADFLHFILQTIEGALHGNPELSPERLSRWSEARHAQVERGELVYIAHQLDFCGRAWEGRADEPG